MQIQKLQRAFRMLNFALLALAAGGWPCLAQSVHSAAAEQPVPRAGAVLRCSEEHLSNAYVHVQPLHLATFFAARASAADPAVVAAVATYVSAQL